MLEMGLAASPVCGMDEMDVLHSHSAPHFAFDS